MTSPPLPPDQSLLALLETVRERGISLEEVGGKLRFRGGADALDGALRAALAERREQVLAFLRAARGADDPIRPSRDGPPPLTPGQLQLWLLEQRGGLGATYHLPLLAILPRRVSAADMSAALGIVVARHASLRTVFAPAAELPLAVTMPPSSAQRVGEEHGLEDLMGVASRPFDLVAGPLFRAAICSLGTRTALLLVAHHIVADGWSMAIVLDELLDLLAGRPLAPEPLWEFADFARWQSAPEQCDSSSAALDALAPAFEGREDLLPLPADRPRPATQDFSGADCGLHLGPDVAQGLDGLAASRRVTPLAILVAGYASALARSSAILDLTIGIVDAGRPFPALHGVVGNFANLLPLRLRFNASDRFTDRIDAAADVLSRLRPFGAIPFARFVDRFGAMHGGAFNPLVQHVVAQNDFAPFSSASAAGIELKPVPLRVARFDTLLSMRRSASGVDGMIEYASALYEPARIRRLADRFTDLVAAAVADPAANVADLDRAGMMSRWPPARLDAAPAEPEPVVAAFLRSADMRPDRLAAADRDGALTYGQLAERSAAIASALRHAAGGPGAMIGLCCGRTVGLLAAILGIWRAGHVYVPLDPANPAERLRQMERGCRLAALVHDGAHPCAWSESLRIDVDLVPAGDGSFAAAELPPGLPAYVMHSSGSTGIPKPIGVSHAALANFLGWTRSHYSRAELAEVPAITGIGFDISLFELLAPLLARGLVRIDDGAVVRLEQPIPAGATLLNTVPSIAAALVEAHPLPAGLRSINLAGEPLPKALAARLHALRPGLRLTNLYGPTEATIYATSAGIGRNAPIVLGGPIAGTRLAILDEELAPVACGDPGWIAIAGLGLAEFYVGQAAMTAERFVPDPAGPPGSRQYLTGDRALLDAQGLHYLGREDRQVKVNGVRIELREVEAALDALDEVAEAAAFVVAVPGRPDRLAALVVPAGPGGWDPARVRAGAATRLPGYMMPALVRVDGLPRLPNGKLDSRRAHALAIQAFAAPGADPPRGPVEEALADIWAELLGSRPDRTDNFFAMGGDSLAALRLVHAIGNRMAVSLPGNAPFAHPVLADLAAAAAAAGDRDEVLGALLARVETLTDEEVEAMLAGQDESAPATD